MIKRKHNLVPCVQALEGRLLLSASPGSGPQVVVTRPAPPVPATVAPGPKPIAK